MPARTARVEYYRSRTGWRWRVIATNGRILAVSSEAYVRHVDAEKALTLSRDALLYVVPTGGPTKG